MTFEEASGAYSLLECIRLTEAGYQRSRPGFTPPENRAFADFLAQAKYAEGSKLQGRIAFDVTFLLKLDRVTGVQRVAFELARSFLEMSKVGGLEFFLIGLNGTFFEVYESTPNEYGLWFRPAGKTVDFRPGDQVLVVDMMQTGYEDFFHAGFRARKSGAVLNFIVHDIIWLVNTSWASDESAVQMLVRWTQILRFADRLICVSRKVSRDVACYIAETSMVGLTPTRSLPVAYFTLGCDPALSGEPQASQPAFPVDRTTLVAVGTFTTRKGLNQLFKAMQLLWAEGSEAKLVLIGMDIGAGNTRRFLAGQPEFNTKLFLPGYVSDSDMKLTLETCGALVYPALDEGFGLPLVEAAHLGCPVIARDIEIFRETSGGDAFFFENGDAGKIAEGLRKWFALSRKQQLKFVPKKSLVTWRQSAEMLKAIMFQGAASISVEVGLKATVNLAVPRRTAGAV